MNDGDPRPDPRAMTDEDLLVELGVAVGSLTALMMALQRETVKESRRVDVEAGEQEWARRADRVEHELARRGFNVIARGVLVDGKPGFGR